jgi:hypothetical protein
MSLFGGLFGKKTSTAPSTLATKPNYGGFGSNTVATKPNYGGFGSNASGGIVKQNTTKKSFFPRGSTSWFTRKNNRVPELSLNQRNGIQKTGFVSAQKNTNSINNIRAKTFEQNFLWRIITKIENSIAVKSTNNAEALNLLEYRELLENPECTEEDAIFLYNELIAMFIMLVIYYQLVIQKTSKFFIDTSSGKVKNPEVLEILFDKKIIVDLIFQGLIFVAATAGIGFGILASPIGIALTTSTGIFAVVAPTALTNAVVLGLTLSAGAGGAAVTTLASMPNNRFSTEIRKEGAKLTESLSGILNYMHFILFSKKNTIPIKSVQSKLKFWGLSKTHVDFLFDRTPQDYAEYIIGNETSMLLYMKDYLTLPKSPALAPNERLNINTASHLDKLHAAIIKDRERKILAETYELGESILKKLKEDAAKKNMSMSEYLTVELRMSHNYNPRIIDAAKCLDNPGSSNISGNISPIKVNEALDSIETSAKAVGKPITKYLEEDLNVPDSQAPTLYDAVEALETTYQSGGKRKKSRNNRNKYRRN